MPSVSTDVARLKNDTADLYDLVARIEKRQIAHERRFARFAKATEDRFTGIEDRFTGIEERFTGIEERFTGIEERFTGVEGHVTGLEGRVVGLEGQMAVVIDIVTRIERKIDGALERP